MRLLIADDEDPARQRLRYLIEEVGGCEVIGEAVNGYEALVHTHERKPDVVLLDIRMPGMDGLEAARHLAVLPRPPGIIFTTAYGDHALEAFEAQAIDYLLKPIERTRLRQALLRAQRLIQSQLSALTTIGQGFARTHLSAYAHGNIRVVPVADIRYFQADHKYVTACFPGGQLLLEEALKALEHEFEPHFLRIHRNALVALSYIQALEHTGQDWRVRLSGIEERLEVSRRHLSSVRRRLKTGR